MFYHSLCQLTTNKPTENCQPSKNNEFYLTDDGEKPLRKPRLVNVVVPSSTSSVESLTLTSDDEPRPLTRRSQVSKPTRRNSFSSSISQASSGRSPGISKDDVDSIKQNLDKLQSQLIETMNEQLQQKQVCVVLPKNFYSGIS